jgi:hypothetical protein
MWRHKTHTAINLVGLTSAFVVVFFIAMLVKDEPSWDRHHSKADRTYRVIANYNTDGGSIGCEFLMLVTISIAIAILWLMNRWLEEFAYRMDIGPMTFVWSGLIAVVIAALTVGSRAYGASRTNPVNALRYE